VDEAIAFYKSKASTDLVPQRDKAVKVGLYRFWPTI
jgi:hypothetical protein